jgi:hypothetical protein
LKRGILRQKGDKNLKNLLLLPAVLSLCLLASACTNDFYTMSDSPGDIAALLYMGPEDVFAETKPLVQEKYFGKLEGKWPEKVETVQAAPWDYYLFLPKYKDTVVTVSEIDMEGAVVSELISTVNPVLIKCNLSDIAPSVKITARYKDSELSFSPFISLKDGSVLSAEHIYTEDCTKMR